MGKLSHSVIFTCTVLYIVTVTALGEIRVELFVLSIMHQIKHMCSS